MNKRSFLILCLLFNLICGTGIHSQDTFHKVFPSLAVSDVGAGNYTMTRINLLQIFDGNNTLLDTRKLILN